jgi:hypothetical protein
MSILRIAAMVRIISPWMILDNPFLPFGCIDMGIYFSGQDTFVAKHLLDSPEVCPILHQMSGKSMSESMGRNLLGDPYNLGLCFHNQKYHYPG